jgi:hypothetical protein
MVFAFELCKTLSSIMMSDRRTVASEFLENSSKCFATDKSISYFPRFPRFQLAFLSLRTIAEDVLYRPNVPLKKLKIVDACSYDFALFLRQRYDCASTAIEDLLGQDSGTLVLIK